MRELVNEIVRRYDRKESLAVCTLVQTRGSTPQKAGAMMVVLQDGKTVGTIGGGCVEAEVRVRALAQMSLGQDQLFSFDLNHDLGWDDGLVCGGSMQVAVQVVADQPSADPFRKLQTEFAEAKETTLKITVPNSAGEVATFVLPTRPNPALVIAGAGHVGSALAMIARQLQFEVTVVDDRADFASAERFPGAAIRIGDVDTELGQVHLNENSFVVIVTRGHRRDALALASVVRSEAAYIGLIGSKRKIARIFAELLEQGVTADQLARVHAPIGLNIGAVTPAEIAVSVAAELIAVRRQSATMPAAPMRLSSAQLQRIVDRASDE